MRIPRRIWVILAGLAAGLLLVAVAALLLVHSGPGKRFVFRRVTQALEARGVRLSASSIDYNLAGPSVSLRDVVVSAANAPDLPPFLRAEEVAAELSLRRLLRGVYWIESAAVRKPQIHVVIAESGRDNIPRLARSGEPGAPVDFLIDRAEVTDASLRFEERPRNILLTLPQWQVVVDGRPETRDHEARLALLEPGMLRLDNRDFAIRGLSAVAVAGRDSVRLNELRLQAGDSVLTASGTLADAGLDAKVSATVQLDPLSPLLAGTVRVDAAARGPLASLRAEARLEGNGLRLERFRNVDLRANAAYNDGRVNIQSLNVQAPALAISGSGDVALTPASGRSTVRADLARADLERLAALFDLPVRVASRASGTVTAGFPGLEFRQADGQARIRLAATKGEMPASGALTARFSGEQRVDVRIESLRAAGVSASGQASLRDRRLDGRILADAALEQMIDQAAGTVHVTADLGGTLDRPRVAATASAPSLKAGGLEGISLTAEASYAPERIEIKTAEIAWKDQVLRANGVVAGKALDLHAKSENLSLPAILAGLGRQDIPAEGTLALTADIAGTTAAPRGAISLTGTGLAIQRQPLGDLDASASLQGRLVRLNHLRLGQTVAASGTYDLDAKRFTVLAKADNFQLPEYGTFNLDAQVAGTREDPQGSIHLEAADVPRAGAVSADVTLANRRAAFTASVPKFQASANGSVGVNAPYPAKIEAAASGADLSEFQVKGAVTGTAAFTGDLADPERGEAVARVEQLNLEWQGENIRSDGPLVARYARRTLTVEQAALAAGASTLRVAGSVPLDATAPPGTLKLNGSFDLPSLARLIPGGEVKAAGTAALDAQISGTLKRIDPIGTLTIRDASVEAPNLNPVTGLTLTVRVENGVLKEELEATWASARIRSSGSVPFGLLPANLPVELPRQGGPASLTVDLDGLQIGSIQGVPSEVGGLVAARLEASAPTANLDAVEASLRFSRLDLKLGDIALSQAGESLITVDHSTARVRRLELEAPQTRLQLSGTAGLAAPQMLNLQASGGFDAALIAALSDSVRAQGPVAVFVALTGPAADFRTNGYVELTDGSLGITSPRVAAENLDARVELKGSRVVVTELSGLLNGGKLSGGGSLDVLRGQPSNLDLNLVANGIYLEEPQGFRTLSNAKIRLRSAGKEFVLGGQVDVIEGSYTEPLTLDRGLLNYIASDQAGLDLEEEPNPVLERLRFNVEIDTENPLLVENNLAKLGIEMDLRLTGTFYQPGLTGRVTLEEGGELRLNERTYLVDRGIVTFVNERRIDPALDILARTEVQDIEIAVHISGGGGERIETTLTSDSDLPETDLMAMLLTGRKLSEVQGAPIDVARDQAFSFLAGSLGGTLSSRLEGITGLSQFRVEPSLIAGEEDPTARLTVGQDITRNLSLVYSMDLTNSSDQIYIGEYDLTRRFVTRGIRQQDNSYRFEFNHEIEFGGTNYEKRDRARRPERRISAIRLQGPTPFPRERLLDALDLETGKKYDFFAAREALDRLRELHWNQGYLESRVWLSREEQERTVALDVRVEAGPKVEFVFEGWSLPGRTRGRVREIWRSGVFDIQRLEDASAAIRGALVEAGHLQAKIEPRITERGADSKRVLFDIAPGPRFRGVELVFDGASGVTPSELKDVIKRAKLEQAVYSNPGRVAETLTAWYRDQGYLDAAIEPPRLELKPDAATGRVLVPVNEGPRYRIGAVEFAGNRAVNAGQLREALLVKPGEVFTPERRRRAVENVTELYNRNGFLDAEVRTSLNRRREDGVVDVTFRIEENRQSVLEQVKVAGTEVTSERLVSSQLAVQPGQIVNFNKLAESRRNLYETGAYQLVDLERDVLNPDEAAAAKRIALNARVREIRPFELSYGGYFDTERGPGGIVTLENRNTLGAARVIGMRGRYDRDLRDGRLYFSQPLLERFPLKTTATGLWRRELMDAFITDRVGISAQQETRFGDHFVLNYGYRIERTHTFDREPDPLFPLDITLRVAPLTASVTRETRDDILDATRGSFGSLALEYAPSLLGSQLRFVRGFAQYFRYIPLSEPEQIPLSTAFKSRWVYAGAVRVGMARGLGGQVLVPSERFFSGGGTSVRGFEQNKLGPLDPLGDELGGNAMLVINNEIRAPLWWIFDGAAFLDLGNVYPRISDFSITDIRKTGGIGLRARTPWFLLRLDYGVKFDMRPGESRGRLFFSIGQAF